ncbi:MAG: aminotransferase class I/II-fold pyridoxal phosphate-dependent enzyme [Actinomycetota bacterium]
MAHIDVFQMERLQSQYWHEVEYDLSESGVLPLQVDELLGDAVETQALLDTRLGYPLSEGSFQTRDHVSRWYEGAGIDNVTITNGGSEANHVTLWSLLEPGDRLAFMVPNYFQGWGLGRFYGEASDTFSLRPTGDTWALDTDELDRVVGPKTKVVMVCNPNNPTGHVLSAGEMDAVVAAADRVGAWIVADEIYRGAEVDSDETTPSFWGRTERVVITSGLSKAFGMPGLRIGWAVAPPEIIEQLWIRHDYTTLTPGMLSDWFASIAMEPDRREEILRRTRRIIRENLPRLEEWIAAQPVLSYLRPKAGAIAYVEYDLPTASTDLIERLRIDQSVLLVPGEMFGLSGGFRIGFGFDVEQTLKALERVAVVLRGLASP